MSEFKREARFIVIKRKHLSAESRVHESLEQELRVWLDKHLIPTSECVVVESDWPEYETVWAMIAARVEGRPTPYQVLEQQVAALRQHKNDYMDAAEGTRRALEAEAQALREEVARLDRESQSLSSQLGACDRERLRFQSQAAALHASMVDAELLRRIVEEQPAVQDIGEMINWQRARDQAIEELRELLGEGKEHE